MTILQVRRKKVGMSQFLLSRSSGVSRMRLSLAETGQITLTSDEEAAVCRALNEYIQTKSQEITELSAEIRASA
jgi:transcriptional regulator with XRE-family HTH domain